LSAAIICGQAGSKLALNVPASLPPLMMLVELKKISASVW
jgi:hypothetical protein